MFIAPVSNYSYSRQNFRTDKYKTNVNPSCQKDSVSFKGTIPIRVNGINSDKVSELGFDLTHVCLQAASEEQLAECYRLYKVFIESLEPHIKENTKVLEAKSERFSAKFDSLRRSLEIGVKAAEGVEYKLGFVYDPLEGIHNSCFVSAERWDNKKLTTAKHFEPSGKVNGSIR